jgi:hypothetical protein
VWKPDPRWVAAELLVATALLGLLPVVDRLGWVILVPTALFAAGSGLRDLLLTPVLVADGTGISVVDGVRRVSAPWSQVERLRTVTDRRTPLLEIDLGDRVVVASRRRLGAPVDEVLAAVLAARQDLR